MKSRTVSRLVWIMVFGIFHFVGEKAHAQNDILVDILSCEGDSTQVQVNSELPFDSWVNEAGTSVGISQPFSPVTYVDSRAVSKVKARSIKVDDNLIFNGDFEKGYYGFLTEYGTMLGMTAFNQYAIGRNPILYSQFFISKGDHTSGFGNMFIADGGGDLKKVIYRADLNIIPEKEYQFSIWLANIPKEFTKIKPDTSLYASASFEFKIDSFTVGSYSLPPDTAWHNFTINWKAKMGGKLHFVIKSKVNNPYGNDFAMDDISFSPLQTIESAEIKISPCSNLPVFSPDGDGQFDSYFINKTGVAKIFDLGGNIVNQISVPGHWDGSTSNGSMADSGYYAIVVDGNVSHVSLIR